MPSHNNLIADGTYALAVSDCRAFPPDLARACLRVVVKSLVAFGNKEEAITRARWFCKEYAGNTNFSEECQQTIIEQIKYNTHYE